MNSKLVRQRRTFSDTIHLTTEIISSPPGAAQKSSRRLGQPLADHPARISPPWT